jgi:hypothetical protein
VLEVGLGLSPLARIPGPTSTGSRNHREYRTLGISASHSNGPLLEDLLQPGPRGLARAGGVELDRADVLQPGQEPEAEQLGEGEPDEASAVGVGVVGLDLRLGAVPEQALDSGSRASMRILQDRLAPLPRLGSS